MDSEIKLLVALLSRNSAARAYASATLLSQKVNVLQFLALCHRHNVIKTVRQVVACYCADSDQPVLIDALEALALRSTAHQLLMVSELCKIEQLLASEQIPTLWFKGPVIAAQLYGDPYARDYSDIDILVKQAYVSKARDILLYNGYIPISQLQLDWEQGYYSPQTLVNVDLHWRITRPTMRDFRSIDLLFEERSSLLLRGRPIGILSDSDTLLMLTMHVAKDYRDENSYLAKLVDIDRFTASRQMLDWDAIVCKAREYDLFRTLLFGLFETKKILKTAFPEQIERLLSAQLPRPLGCVDTEAHHFDERRRSEVASIRKIRKLMFEVALIGSYWGRSKAMVALATNIARPNCKDFALVELPKMLRVTYYVLRIVRLALRLIAEIFNLHPSRAGCIGASESRSEKKGSPDRRL